MCMYSSSSCGKVEYMLIEPLRRVMFEIYFQIGQSFFRFILNFQILKLYLRFQINSNGFSRDRSFRHKTFSTHVDNIFQNAPQNS